MDALGIGLLCAGIAIIVLFLACLCCYCRQRNKPDHQRDGSPDKYHSTTRSYHHTVSIPPPSHVSYTKDRTQEYDLHGMTLREAMGCVEEALDTATPGTTVNLVTGRGLHSTGGKPVIKPKVERYLKDNGYDYKWRNAGGMVSVLVQ